MSVVSYAPGIEYVKGSLAKPKKVDGHNHGEYLIGTHRTAATTNPNCTRLYVRKADTYVRKTAPSRDEMNARQRFAAVSAMVRARSKDLMQINEDQTNFLAQKDSPNGFKTMKSYLWAICGDIYDAEQNG